MAQLTKCEVGLFPLRNVEAVVNFFKTHLSRNSEPNLAILSIIVGYIENTLTCSRISIDIPIEETDFSDFGDPLKTKLPPVEYDDVEALYQRFLAIIKAHVDVTAFGSPKYATRELVKRVSDVVWCTLSSSYYKDRAHLQSIYSYMTGAKLDSYGTTLAVVAALQVLGYNDAHLCLSEDHTWIVCGEYGEITVEVTWHGKGNEDKRGLPVTEDIFSKSWLYVNGRPVICNRYMEVATIISNVNPGINATTDSEEALLLQQALLWFMYDSGHLAKYPMAIDNLGDLEEMCATKGSIPATKLYEEAILSNIEHYGNQHVYPYTYLGGYCYRNKMYKMALKAWAWAATVIKNYNYSRDDEEIYKEFLEIANELIPHLIKVVSGINSDQYSFILRDTDCFAYILTFYDGVCEWEEGSQTPVLHIGWAKALLSSIAKFHSDVRANLKIKSTEGDDKNSTSSEKEAFFVSEKMFECTTTYTENQRSDHSHDQNGNTRSTFKDVKIGGGSTSLILHSAKMNGLKDLLLADKLNSQAISLQLTAQSQVTLSKKRGSSIGGGDDCSTGRSKRTRRDQ